MSDEFHFTAETGDTLHASRSAAEFHTSISSVLPIRHRVAHDGDEQARQEESPGSSDRSRRHSSRSNVVRLPELGGQPDSETSRALTAEAMRKPPTVAAGESV